MRIKNFFKKPKNQNLLSLFATLAASVRVLQSITESTKVASSLHESKLPIMQRTSNNNPTVTSSNIHLTVTYIGKYCYSEAA